MAPLVHFIFTLLYASCAIAGPGHIVGPNDAAFQPRADGGFPAAPGGGGGGYPKNEFLTAFPGAWALHNPNAGVAAMQLQLMPNNKAVWFDATSLGPSARELGPPGNCPRITDNGNNEPDCWAHAILYDVETGDSRTILLDGDPWCSSGNLWPNGDMVNTGGTHSGARSVRYLTLNDPNANFIERKDALIDGRWYASNQVLEDGSAIVVGGRDSYSYEIVPPQTLNFVSRRFALPFLQQTTEAPLGPGRYVENNLYPFLFLIPDGSIFIFANNRAITFNPQSGLTIREFPVLGGGSRNYPPSGQAAMFPLKLSADPIAPVQAEIVVCGGNKPEAFSVVDAKYNMEKVYLPALQDCNRIKVTVPGSVWEKEENMPSPRTMGDLLLLPTASDLLFINGARKGTSGWEDAVDPNFTPVVYRPNNPIGQRFREMAPTTIARMYHSCSALLPDGKVLVAGSNPHHFYTFNVDYPTELRVEKFSPHYLDPVLDPERPIIVPGATDVVLKYGKPFKVTFTHPAKKILDLEDVRVTLYYPPFTTHGFSQNQRLLVPALTGIVNNVVTGIAPASGKVAPPGYYVLYLNHRGVPGRGIWVHIG